jgi:hypothetical protein
MSNDRLGQIVVLIQVVVAQFWIISICHKSSPEPMPINHFSGTHLESYFAQVASKASTELCNPGFTTKHAPSGREFAENH